LLSKNIEKSIPEQKLFLTNQRIVQKW